MIRMLGIVGQQPLGTDKSTYDRMVRHTERMFGLTEDTFDKPVVSETLVNTESKITRSTLQKLVKEEYTKILDEARKAAPKIEKKLEECRKEMMAEFVQRERIGSTFDPVMEKRIQINTVSEMIDVPVNELVLYFINNVKTSNTRKMVEYRLGHVYFYAL